MNRRSVAIVGPRLHAVPEIDHDRPGSGGNVDPSIVESLGLQTSGVVLQEQSECPGIGVIAEGGLAQFG